MEFSTVHDSDLVKVQTLVTAGKPTDKNNIYSLESLEQMVRDFHEKQQGIYGCLRDDVLDPKATTCQEAFIGHRNAAEGDKCFSMDLESVSHTLTKLEIVGDDLIGTFRVLKTPKGNILKELLDKGVGKFNICVLFYPTEDYTDGANRNLNPKLLFTFFAL